MPKTSRPRNRTFEPTIRIINLGAGVQSSTLLLMALEGKFDHVPDAAIFADTGWEPSLVYAHLWYLAEICAEHSFPLYIVSNGHIRNDALNPNHRFASMPLHINRGPSKKSGMARRQCTREYKIEPIRKKVRELLGVKPRKWVPGDVLAEQWFGISYDEIERMNEPRFPWLKHRYPLIDHKLTRDDCLKWCEERDIRPPRSACIGCPFHSDNEWRWLRDNLPDEFEDAVDFDHRIRQGQYGGKGAPLDGDGYLHSSLQPLDEIQFADKESSHADECGGHCFM